MGALAHERRTRADRGDPDEAEQLAAEPHRIGIDGGEPDAASIFDAQRKHVRWLRGTIGDLNNHTDEPGADDPGTPASNATLAMAHAEGDRFDAARHLLEELAAFDFVLPLDPDWLTGFDDVRRSCDPQYAEPIFALLAPWSEQLVYNDLTSAGPVSHYLGGLATVLVRYDEADAYFTQAAAFNVRIDAKFFAARANLSWGEMLAARNAPGDAEKARALIAQARTAAAANGYANVERRAAQAFQHLD